MLLEESFWIQEQLTELGAKEISPVLNIGSSTLHFRKIIQPFIHENIFEPLQKQGVTCFHLDMKAAEGVDIVGDLTDVAFQQQLQSYACKLFICSNLLEHIASPQREELCKIMQDLLPNQGYLLLTVPHSYPYHKDPIDTMFRPDVASLARLFPNLVLVKGAIVEKQKSIFADTRRRLRGFAVNLVHSIFPTQYGLSPLEQAMEKQSLPYWFKRYSVCCVLLQKR